MGERLVDGIIALLALAAVVASLGTIIVYVPEVPLAIVLIIGMLMVAYDFFSTFFRNRRDR